MSTKITDITDAMIARLAALLPTASRIPNAYRLEENNVQFLKLGYGLKIGAGQNTNRELCGKISIRREFGVVLTRQMFANDSAADPRVAAEKLLLEDKMLIARNFETDGTLNSALNNAIYVGDSGVNFIYQERDNYITTEITISAEYFETT
jgi:hypothetical protein